MIILPSRTASKGSNPAVHKPIIIGLLLFCVFVPGMVQAESEENTYISRIEKLEKSLYQHVQNPALEKELAQVYLDYSRFLAGEKRFREARDFLDMAKGLGLGPGETSELESEIDRGVGATLVVAQDKAGTRPALAPEPSQVPEGVLIGKALSYQFFQEALRAYQDKNYELAQDQATRVLEYDPENKYAHELLGDISYQTQNLAKAKFHWERSITRENMERVQTKLAKVGKEIPVESSLKATEEEHFVIRYDHTQKEVSSYELKTLLREAYREIYQDLGVPMRGKGVVILYPPEVFERSVKPQHWSGALFDGKIRIPLTRGEEARPEKRQALKKMIWHELAHVFVYEIGGKSVPLWIQEGIGQYEEDKIVHVPLDVLRKANAGGMLYRLKDLERGEKLFKGVETVQLFYQQSFMVTKFLIQRYGFFKVREILKAIGKGESFDSALLLVLNVSPDQLEKSWRAWLKENL